MDIKVVILAGGFGTRLSEETELRPKPMVEIGGKPILWHIMKHAASYGARQFLVALGYKGEMIKHYFIDFNMLNASITVNLADNQVSMRDKQKEDWIVHLVDTGMGTMTGGRIKRLAPFLQEGTFMVTYGDGLINLDLSDLLRFHRASGKLATVTAVRPPARFGRIIFDGDRVVKFQEKPLAGEGWINGGYIFCEPGILEYIENDATSLEADTLTRLAADGQLAAYRHDGFWQCMDTLRDKRLLEGLWERNEAPWRVWE